MTRELKLDIINIFVSLIISSLLVWFGFLDFPFWIRILPVSLFVVPVGIILYKKRLETKRVESQKIIDKAIKLRPLLVQLEKVKNISTIASRLTHQGIKFIENEVTYLGWRKYFDIYDKVITKKFDDLQVELNRFIDTEKQEHEEFSRILKSFYWLVSGFRHLYADLAKMVELAGKEPPIDEQKNIQELEENYNDFFKELKQLCNEVEEVKDVFRGRYPVIHPLEKISDIHRPKQ